MRSKIYVNRKGWGLTLIVHPGRGASLSLYQDGKNVVHKTYEWDRIQVAEKDAEALIELGEMEPAA